MEINIKSLSVLLILQLFLATTLIYTGKYREDGDARGLVINQTRDNVSQIVIADDTSEVKLALRDNVWLVTSESDFPANSDKVTRLLEGIEELSSQATTVVAVTEAAQTRFQVASEDYNKRIRVIGTDDRSEELFLGSSPGLDLAHIRKSDDDAIHVAKFPTYQASSSSSDWIDKSVLKINSEDIVYMGIGEIVLRRSEKTEDTVSLNGETSQSNDQQNTTENQGIWVAEMESGLDKPLSQNAAEDLVKQIERLRFTDLLEKSEIDQEVKDTLVLRLQLGDGKEMKYSIRKSGNENSYYLVVSGWDQLFSIGSYTAERLIEAASEEVLFPADV